MQKEKNEFIRRVLLLIGTYLVLLIVNIDTMKVLAEGNTSIKELINMKKENSSSEDNGKIADDSTEVTQKDVKEKVLDHEKENNKEIQSEKSLVDNGEKNQENNSLEEEVQKTEQEDSKENELVSNIINNNNYLYTKSNLKVYNDTDIKLKALDTLSKGIRIKRMEEKNVTTQKEKKVKGSDGKTIIKKEDVITKWEKIKYKKNQKEVVGWILADNITSNYHELLPDNWKDLDFNHISKANYPNNPRIKVKGIYVSGSSAGLTSRVDNLIALSKRTGINAFVIDVKNDEGYLLFNMEFADKYSDSPNKYNQIKDIEVFMKKLKDNNIYTIARVVSFKDPAYARKNPDRTILDKKTNKPYVNKDKVIWVSPHDRNLWEYNIEVSKEAARVGFNEIQFDYVRFPATGGAKVDANIDYRNPKNESKPVAIQQYLKYAREHLEPMEVYIAADVYGQIGSATDDMSIGQYWESVSNVADYICPMIYPSHYNPGVYGVPIPDADPYNTVYRCVRDEINRNENIDEPSLIRPWIQAFTAKWVKGHIKYGYAQIQAQVKALADLGIEDYILWSPTNIYSMLEKNPAKEVKKEPEKKEGTEAETKIEAPKNETKKVQENKNIAPNTEKKSIPKTTTDKKVGEKQEAKKASPPKEVKKDSTIKSAAQPAVKTTLKPQPAATITPKEVKKEEPKKKPEGKLIDRFKKVTN